MFGLGGLVKKIGWAFPGVMAAKKLLGVFDGPPDPNANAYNISPEDRARINQGYGQSQEDRSRQIAFINTLQNQAQGYNPLIDMLSAQSRGEGPSLIAGQLQQATNANISNQMSQAAGNRSINPALAARMASQNTASINQNAAFDSSQARLAEILQAQNQQLAARNARADVYGNAGNLASNIRGQGLNQQQISNAYGFGNRDAQIQFDSAMRNQPTFLQRMQPLLGAAGTAVGAMYGGPAGAAVGGQVGNSIGGSSTGLTTNNEQGFNYKPRLSYAAYMNSRV